MIQINFTPKTLRIYFDGVYKHNNTEYAFRINVLKAGNIHHVKSITWLDDYDGDNILEVEEEIKKDFLKDINKTL